eukprot:577636-Pelagomonas_calceolata.AAC.1
MTPQQILLAAQEQHKNTIQGIHTKLLRGTHRNNQVTLHVILIVVAGIIKGYKGYKGKKASVKTFDC